MMMKRGVWAYQQLLEWAKDYVDPFIAGNVQPASIDLLVGNKLRLPNKNWSMYGASRVQQLDIYESIDRIEPTWEAETFFDRMVIMPGEMVLCHTEETVQIPADASAMLMLKSSAGRNGWSLGHTGWGEAGFGWGDPAQWTFQLRNVGHRPLMIEHGESMVQMIMLGMAEAPVMTYDTREGNSYQGQRGPTPDRMEK